MGHGKTIPDARVRFAHDFRDCVYTAGCSNLHRPRQLIKALFRKSLQAKSQLEIEDVRTGTLCDQTDLIVGYTILVDSLTYPREKRGLGCHGTKE